MTEPANRPPLLNAFDALSDRGPPRDIRATGLPLSIIALLVALIGGLFVAIVVEDRQLQREALHRDADSAASQLTTRLGALTEALTTTALEIGNGTVAERRFASIAHDLSAAKPELLRLKRVDETGRMVWLPVASSAPTQPLEPALDAALRAAQDLRAPVTVLLEAGGAAGGTMLALVAPIRTDARPAGALVARVGLAELLRHGLNAEIRERYRFELHAGPRVVAASGPSTLPADLPSAEAALAPYGPDLRLLAIAYRSGTPLAGRALVWVVAGLSIAVAIALLTLMQASSRQARVDRALLAEASLRRAMEQSLATGLRVIDRDGVIRYVNRAFCQMTGWAEAQLVGCAPPYPYWPAEHREDHEAQLARLLAGEPTDAALEVVVQRPDGTRFDARLYVSPLVDDNERQIGWMTSMTDITEPKRIRNELAAAHQQFTTMLESLDAAVSVVASAAGGDGELLFANRAYRERLGLGADGHHKLASRLRRAGSASSGAELFDEESGRWFDVRLRSIRWPGSGGDVAGRDAELQIASDITLRKATEDIVRQQQEKVQFTSRLMTMGEMASSLAHELNQPLTAIANYSEGITARVRAGEIPREQLLAALDKTSVQAQRAGRIIRRIREFVKRSEPRRRPTAAARVVEDAIGFAEIEAAKKRIAIAVDIDPALPPLDIDPLLIEQVLLNLLKNAIDAMDHAGIRRIDVRVGRADAEGMAEFAVTDRGSGIPPEHVPNLFQPFFSTKEEGMGMGLNICRSIIEFHHGRLSVEPNPEPTGGTVMRFTLPIAGALDATRHDDDAADRPAPATETPGP